MEHKVPTSRDREWKESGLSSTMSFPSGDTSGNDCRRVFTGSIVGEVGLLLLSSPARARSRLRCLGTTAKFFLRIADINGERESSLACTFGIEATMPARCNKPDHARTHARMSLLFLLVSRVLLSVDEREDARTTTSGPQDFTAFWRTTSHAGQRQVSLAVSLVTNLQICMPVPPSPPPPPPPPPRLPGVSNVREPPSVPRNVPPPCRSTHTAISRV